MNWTKLKTMPHVRVSMEGKPEENILIRDRCDTCSKWTKPERCPVKCKRFDELPPAWTGPVFYKTMEADAVQTYREMYPENCNQLELF